MIKIFYKDNQWYAFEAPLHAEICLSVYASNLSKAHLAVDYKVCCGASGVGMEHKAGYKYDGFNFRSNDGLLKWDDIESIVSCKKCLSMWYQKYDWREEYNKAKAAALPVLNDDEIWKYIKRPGIEGKDYDWPGTIEKVDECSEGEKCTGSDHTCNGSAVWYYELKLPNSAHSYTEGAEPNSFGYHGGILRGDRQS